MSETTPNLGLFKYNPITDGKETFSIQAALNDNWDIIDEKCSRGSGFNLFDTKISDHILEGDSAVGWALQGTYVNGAVYSDFYAKCLEEYNEATETETVNDVTVKVNSNGHKFYNIADKTAIDEFYNSLGTAWFYGVDTEQERIFLPRNKYFEQLTTDTTEVGQSVEAGLPNINGLIDGVGRDTGTTASGAFYTRNSTSGACSSTGYAYYGLTFDASRSNPIYGNSDTVQTPSVKKLLYICVGNTIVNAGQMDASKVLSEAVLRSSLEQVHVVVETYRNDTSWYRVWSDGWCEQGGVIEPQATNPTTVTITFLKSFVDTNYHITKSILLGSSASGSWNIQYTEFLTKTTQNCSTWMSTSNYNQKATWIASGYIW